MSGLGATINRGIQTNVAQQQQRVPSGWNGLIPGQAPSFAPPTPPSEPTPEQVAAQQRAQAQAQAQAAADREARVRARQGAQAAGSMSAWLSMTPEQQNALLQPAAPAQVPTK